MSKRRSLWRWVRRATVVVLMLAIALVVIVTWVPLGKGPTGNGGGVGPVSVEIQLGSIKANNKFSSTSYTSGGKFTKFTASRIAVVNESKTLLMRRVGPLIAGQLRQLPYVDTVDYFTDGPHPRNGGRLYDLYVVLTMPKFKTSGWLITGRTIDATVDVFMGRDWFQSSHNFLDNLTPPVLNAHAMITLDHHSVTRGYESANANYQLAAKNIAQQINGSLSKRLRKWSGKYGVAKAWPAQLYGRYEKVPANLPLPQSAQLRRVLSGSGLMLHNHTVWTLTTPHAKADLIGLRDRLKNAGWSIVSVQLTYKDQQYYIRAIRQGGEGCEAFVPYSGHPGTASKSGPARLVISYRDRMTSDEIAPTINRLLSDPSTTTADLVMFENRMNTSQKNRLLEHMRKHLPRTADAMVTYARLLHRRKNNDAAMARLADACLLARADGEDVPGDARRLAKKITGVSHWQPPVPDDAALKRLGFKQVHPGTTTHLTLNVDTAGEFYLHQGSIPAGALLLVTVQVQHATDPDGIYTLVLRCDKWAGGGTSSAITPHGHSAPWQAETNLGAFNGGWYAHAKQIAPARFSIIFKAKPHGRTNP